MCDNYAKLKTWHLSRHQIDVNMCIMAQYIVNRLNYITVGKTEKIINLDVSLQSRYVIDTDLDNYRSTDDNMFSSVNLDVLFDSNTSQDAQRSNYDISILSKSIEKVFVCDIDEKSGIFGQYNSANRTGFRTSDGVLIHNLYDISDLAIKSRIQKIKDTTSTTTSLIQKNSSECLDIYAPNLTSDNIINICQLADFAYCLIDRTTCGPNTLQTTLRTERATVDPNSIKDNFYSWQITSHELPTYLYSTEDNIQDTTQLSNFFRPRYNLKNIAYNYIIEIPQTFSIYNDYQVGDILGEIMQAKNVYDASYSMNVVSSEQLCLSSTRQYCGIDTCGNNVFLKFYDNIDYMFEMPTCVETDRNTLTEIQTTENTKKRYPYQKLETLDGINKFRANIKHKSNLFSINIDNTGIDSLSIDNLTETQNQKLRAQIKSDIKNQVRTLARKFCPADTCLFDVYFDRGELT